MSASDPSVNQARRAWIKRLGLVATPGLLSACAGNVLRPAETRAAPRVIVVGGGFGGAIAAKYLKMFDPQLQVTMIEPNPMFTTSPFSNTVLVGLKSIQDITFDYQQLSQRYGVQHIQDSVVEIDPVHKRLRTASGLPLEFDKLVVSPGVDFRFDTLEGYSKALSEHQMPHAWKAGPQTLLLKRQLEAMPDGGVVAICPPVGPFRCPPAPVERVSLIAHYLKQHKPRSKVLYIDAKRGFPEQEIIKRRWDSLYKGMIETVQGGDGIIDEVIAHADGTSTLVTGFEEHHVQVANLIPPHKAGLIAATSDLTDESGWCPVNQHTFESTRHKDIHIVGDACIAGEMPKSGFSANNQAKMCAAAIVAGLRGEQVPTGSWINTCYSLLSPDEAISISRVYKLSADNKIVGVHNSSGTCPINLQASREKEAVYARGWYDSITSDMFT